MRHKTIVPQRRRSTTLSLSGGGVCGFGTVHQLLLFQAQINASAHQLAGGDFTFVDKFSKRWSNCIPLNAVFSTIAGTSIGAAIAAPIRAGLTIDQVADLISGSARAVFPPFFKRSVNRIYRRIFGLGGLSVPWFDGEDLYRELQRAFRGIDFGAVDRLIIVAMSAAPNRRPMVLKNWKQRWWSWKLWEAAAASASPPIYLPPFGKTRSGPDGKTQKLYFSDGGTTGANNPSLVALIEDAKFWGRMRGEFDHPQIVSFGAGFHNQNLDGAAMQKWGAAQYIPEVYPAGFIKEPEEMVTYIADFLLNRNPRITGNDSETWEPESDTLGDLYTHFNFEYRGASGRLDDSSDTHLQALQVDAIYDYPDDVGAATAERLVHENFAVAGGAK